MHIHKFLRYLVIYEAAHVMYGVIGKCQILALPQQAPPDTVNNLY